jgi:hypothetical protein
MMKRFQALGLLFMACAVCAAVSLAITACDTPDFTKAVVDNAYPELADGGDPSTQVVVYKAWFVTTLFTEPVLPAQSSDELRSVPATDTAYALLAPGWDPEGTAPPTTLIAVQSKSKLSVGRGDLLHLAVSDATFTGSCAAKQPLSQADADFITQRIFPGAFADKTYDAATCTSTPIPGNDAAADAGTEGDDASEGGAVEGGVDAGPG